MIKAIIQALPFKKELYSILKSVWTPPERIWRHLYFKGTINVQAEHGRSFKMQHYGYQLENELFWAGLKNGWEKESMRLWLQLVKDAQVIFDIGANTGVYSLVAKTLQPSARVYAFEPVMRVYNKLKENIRLNNYDIRCRQLGVSNANGTAVFYDLPAEHVYSVTINKNLNSSGVDVIETEVNIITLDTFIEEERLERIDLVKIDVETHEPEVLEGFRNGLHRFRPVLLIEILTLDVGKRVEEIVRDLGYSYFNIDEKGSIRQTSSIGQSDYYNYLLCSPDTAAQLGLCNKEAMHRPL